MARTAEAQQLINTDVVRKSSHVAVRTAAHVWGPFLQKLKQAKNLYNHAYKCSSYSPCNYVGVRAIVLDVDTKQQRLSLGLKASFFSGAEEEDEEEDAEVGVMSDNLKKHRVLIPRAVWQCSLCFVPQLTSAILVYYKSSSSVSSAVANAKIMLINVADNKLNKVLQDVFNSFSCAE